MKPVLTAGKNCWRIEHADRLSFLIDAAAYFKAFRSAAIKAQHSILIIGWDIDSRLDLLREDPDDGYPVQLGDFLNTLAQQRSGLKIRIILWDFDLLFGLDREWLPVYKLDWKMHHRIRLRMDDMHPVGGCHHDKIVVIDDCLAFCGGLDLTKARWDTQEHLPRDERRRTPDDDFYRPHHDVQALAAGDIARALGEFFRQRWQMLGGEKIPMAPADDKIPPWPDNIDIDAANCRVAIARTQPEYKDLPETREVEQLYLDAVAAARQSIYIENQYLTSPKITAALARRLRQDDSPEVIIVMPYTTEGWISKSTMDVFRARAFEDLRQADRHNRLGIYYVHHDNLDTEHSIKIHAKLMVCDNDFIRIGSANLNNRSMGIDTECDLAMEASGREDLQQAIDRFRARLLAEHLDADVGALSQAAADNPSLLFLIDRFGGGRRTLQKLAPEVPEIARSLQEQQDILDPEKPINPEEFLDKWFGGETREKGRFPLAGFTAIVVLFLALATAWRFTPLHELLTENRLTGFIETMRQSPYGLIYAVGAFVAGGLVSAPVTGLIVLSLIIFGSIKGFVYALLGSILSAAATYQIGALLGRNVVRRFAGQKVNALSRKIGRRGILSTAVVRMVPVAPFSIVNMIAGASHIRFRDFIIGTMLGLLPGMLALTGIVDRGMAVITRPDWRTFTAFFVIVALIIAASFFLGRWLQKQGEDS